MVRTEGERRDLAEEAAYCRATWEHATGASLQGPKALHVAQYFEAQLDRYQVLKKQMTSARWDGLRGVFDVTHPDGVEIEISKATFDVISDQVVVHGHRAHEAYQLLRKIRNVPAFRTHPEPVRTTIQQQLDRFEASDLAKTYQTSQD